MKTNELYQRYLLADRICKLTEEIGITVHEIEMSPVETLEIPTDWWRSGSIVVKTSSAASVEQFDQLIAVLGEKLGFQPTVRDAGHPYRRMAGNIGQLSATVWCGEWPKVTYEPEPMLTATDLF